MLDLSQINKCWIPSSRDSNCLAAPPTLHKEGTVGGLSMPQRRVLNQGTRACAPHVKQAMRNTRHCEVGRLNISSKPLFCVGRYILIYEKCVFIFRQIRKVKETRGFQPDDSIALRKRILALSYPSDFVSS